MKVEIRSSVVLASRVVLNHPSVLFLGKYNYVVKKKPTLLLFFYFFMWLFVLYHLWFLELFHIEIKKLNKNKTRFLIYTYIEILIKGAGKKKGETELSSTITAGGNKHVNWFILQFSFLQSHIYRFLWLINHLTHKTNQKITKVTNNEQKHFSDKKWNIH